MTHTSCGETTANLCCACLIFLIIRPARSCWMMLGVGQFQQALKQWKGPRVACLSHKVLFLSFFLMLFSRFVYCPTASHRESQQQSVVSDTPPCWWGCLTYVCTCLKCLFVAPLFVGSRFYLTSNTGSLVHHSLVSTCSCRQLWGQFMWLSKHSRVAGLAAIINPLTMWLRHKKLPYSKPWLTAMIIKEEVSHSWCWIQKLKNKLSSLKG